MRINGRRRTLAIASHVVSGFVGNNVVVYVLQTLGFDVAALNTVQFSNHTGYHRKKGSAVTAEEIEDLWQGLKDVGLHEDIGMLLSGYVPGAVAVKAVGRIAAELKDTKDTFWLLDPVMGDEGKLYVNPDVVPAYQEIIRNADLITPNQYEVEWLCGLAVRNLSDLRKSLQLLHDKFMVPHIVITSVVFEESSSNTMFCAGSTIDSNGRARPFLIEFPVIEGHFRGTGDLFSALTLVRLREEAENHGVLSVRSWVSPDTVSPTDLPLTKAIERVLLSMNLVLSRTSEARRRLLESLPENQRAERINIMRAGELKLIESRSDIVQPKGPPFFRASLFPIA